MHRILFPSLVLCLSFTACQKDEAKTPASPTSTASSVEESFSSLKVRGTPIELGMPPTWTSQRTNPKELVSQPALSADAGPKKLILHSRSMFSARAPAIEKLEFGRPWLVVYHDPYLPRGTTATQYLEAQRASNQVAVEHLRHVEAERGRRNGRPSYHVRDEFDAPTGDGRKIRLSQEALLLVDVDPKDPNRVHGYSVILTMAKNRRNAILDDVHKIFDSVQFSK